MAQLKDTIINGFLKIIDPSGGGELNVKDSIDDINNDITEINNKLEVDYIIEQGTSDIWTYRKWASGIAECWGIINVTYANTNVLINSSISYPFTFLLKPTIVACLNDSGGNSTAALDWNIKVINNIDKCTVSLHDVSGGFSSSSNTNVSVHVIGTI